MRLMLMIAVKYDSVVGSFRCVSIIDKPHTQSGNIAVSDTKSHT